jgi:hypothetical protein
MSTSVSIQTSVPNTAAAASAIAPRVVDNVDGRLDQESVMYWSAHRHTSLSREATRNAQHLSAVRLHREVSQSGRTGAACHVEPPAEDRAHVATQQCHVNRFRLPIRKHWVRTGQHPQQCFGLNDRGVGTNASVLAPMP